ncbi:MAG: ABC transporter permease [Vicinamibacterales bacterium]
MWRDLLIRLRALVRRRAMEDDLDAELRFHRERQLEAYARAGLSPDEARRRLALEFGGLDQTREACRDARGVTMIEHLMQDVRYGLRALRRTPGFTLVAVLTLGLGLGANTAIFSVVYGVLLRPLPYADPSALVVMNETTPKVGLVSVSYPNYADWRAASRSFSAMAIVVGVDYDLTGGSQPEAIHAEAVSSNYLSMLGVRPALGRDFTAGEDQPGAARVAILGHALWQAQFGGDAGVVGRTLTLDGDPVTVIGVLPEGLRASDSSDLLIPVGVWLGDDDQAAARGNRGNTVVIGRLATGADLDRARTEMGGIAAGLAREHPDTNAEFGVALRPLREVLVGDVRPALLVLFGTVVCVLLIACANVANLSLIRGAGRAREMALRVAIGAGRRRLVAQLLVESAMVAALGGLVGLALAFAGTRGLLRWLPADIVEGATITLNGPVLAFTGVAVLAATLVFGLTPALQAARTDVTTDLNEGGRSATSGRRQRRWRGALAVAEIALALVLLVGAGLMLRSLSALLAVDPGVRTDGVLTMYVGLSSDRYDADEAKQAFWTRLLADAGALPGVEQVALGTNVPLTDNHSRTDISIDGQTFPVGALPHPDVHIVSPGYFRALGISVREGRAFVASDRAGARRVGLVNRTLAERYFAGVDPVGQRFAFGRQAPGAADARWITIVGVVDDTRMYGLDNPSRLEVYVPLGLAGASEMTLVVRTSGDPAALVPSLRSVVAAIDPERPISDVATLTDLRDASLATRRVTLLLLVGFSALALALAALGIYGVMSYGVAQRTNEFGIRLALGARPRDLLRTVLGPGLALAGAGIGIGIALALGLTRLMSALLFSVSAADPATFVSVSAGVALIAFVACLIPGWRALRVDPQMALRRS